MMMVMTIMMMMMITTAVFIKGIGLRAWLCVIQIETDRGVINAGDSVVVLLGDHERGEVGRVAGSEEHGE